MRFVFVFVLAGWLLAPFAASAGVDLLNAHDLEQAGGLRNLQLVDQDAKIGAAGDLNFAGKDGKLVCIVTVRQRGWYAAWKTRIGVPSDEIRGVGDEAFGAPHGHHFNYVVFRKGQTAVLIQSIGKRGHERTFSVEQLTQLARAASARL